MKSVILIFFFILSWIPNIVNSEKRCTKCSCDKLVTESGNPEQCVNKLPSSEKKCLHEPKDHK